MDEAVLEELRNIVGPDGWTSDPVDLEPQLTEWRGVARGETPVMLMPENTEQVSAVLAVCSRENVAVVPQGGNTGLCGGAIPDPSGSQVLLNLRRMNRVRSVSAGNFSMTVEAGCVLANIQAEVERHDRLFPLSLAAEGSCQIGGNLATDAGGINVIRYGTAREQVLGLEVVLADGSVIDGLRGLRKDTAGYDLKQLFLGSEGTLGVITAATLKLHPQPGELSTAFVALQDAGQAIQLLAVIRETLGDRIQAFELISARSLEFVQTHMENARLPLEGDSPWFVLLETADSEDLIQSALMKAMDAELVSDVVLAKNRTEAEDFWYLRHSISAAQKFEGASLKHDVAVPIDQIPVLLQRGEALQKDVIPGSRLCAFGHVGDGNLHFNVSQPKNVDPDNFRREGQQFTTELYQLVKELGGTFSAEHGVGVFKKAHLVDFRSEAEMSLMKVLKRSLDPKNILNPGKVI